MLNYLKFVERVRDGQARPDDSDWDVSVDYDSKTNYYAVSKWTDIDEEFKRELEWWCYQVFLNDDEQGEVDSGEKTIDDYIAITWILFDKFSDGSQTLPKPLDDFKRNNLIGCYSYGY